MINPLTEFLKKKGIKDFSELSEEEKKTYREWEGVLVGKKLTDEDVAGFLGTELEDVLLKLSDPDLLKPENLRKDIFLKVKLDFIRKVKMFLASPEVARAMLEENINKQT